MNNSLRSRVEPGCVMRLVVLGPREVSSASDDSYTDHLLADIQGSEGQRSWATWFRILRLQLCLRSWSSTYRNCGGTENRTVGRIRSIS
jgi:hypothetical protein